MANNVGTGPKASKKFKGKTMDLNALLCDIPHVNWAEATETEHQRDAADVTTIDISMKTKIVQTRQQLPSGPKSSRDNKVNLNSVPTEPPFSAYVGNIPYDAVEQDLRALFEGLDIETVKIITDRETGAVKGHGYVHFRDRESLITALGKNQEKIRDREVRIDLTQSNKPQDSRSQESMGEAVTTWRNARQPPPPMHMQQPPRPQGPPPPHNYGPPPPHYQQHYDMRGPRPMMPMQPPRGYQQPQGGPPPHQQQRPYDNYGYDNRRAPYPSPAGYPADHYGRYPGGDYNYPQPQRGGRRDNYGPPQGRMYDSPRPPMNQHRYDGGGGRYPQQDRYYHNEQRQDQHRAGGYHATDPRSSYAHNNRNQPQEQQYNRNQEPAQRQEEAQRTRPKLQLQPRTKKEGDGDSNAAEESKKASIIFGGAKPVDTREKESDIEQKIEKQNQEIHKKVEEERMKHDEARSMKGDSRRVSERTYSQSSTGSGHHPRTPTSPSIHSAAGEIKLTPGAGQVRILARSRPNSESQQDHRGNDNVWKKQQSLDSAEPIAEEVEQKSESARETRTNGAAGDVRRGRGQPYAKSRVFSNRGGSYPRTYNDNSRGGRGGRGGSRGRGRGGDQPQRVGRGRAPPAQQPRRGSAGGSPEVAKLPTYEEPKAPDFGDANRFNMLGLDAEDADD